MADVEVEQSEGVMWVRLNRPEKKNAVTLPMWAEMEAAFSRADLDPEVRAVVVCGAGGNFCAGADLTGTGGTGNPSRAGSLEDKTIEMLRNRISPAAVALHRLRKPSIAMVEGVAAGAGCNLAIGCDLVYAAEGARFSQIFVRRALSLDFGGSWLLPRLVGRQKARELALFGDLVPAPEALRIGMIAGVLPDDELESHVRERAERLAGQSPLAMQSIKRVLDDSAELSFADAIDHEFVVQAKCTTSEDFAEGLAAFLEKRAPKFGGR